MTNSALFNGQDLRESRKRLLICALIAFFAEFGILALTGLRFSPLVHTRAPVEDMIEAEVVNLEEEQPKLVSARVAAPSHEETLAQKKSQKPVPVTSPSLSENPSNVVSQGKPMSPTHGPVLIESPSPVIPEYLKNQDINSKVVIEFTVRSNGDVSPRLLVSSGNEELDQIALGAASKWKFFPAESNHQAIDAKVKLRILFEVK